MKQTLCYGQTESCWQRLLTVNRLLAPWTGPQRGANTPEWRKTCWMAVATVQANLISTRCPVPVANIGSVQCACLCKLKVLSTDYDLLNAAGESHQALLCHIQRHCSWKTHPYLTVWYVYIYMCLCVFNYVLYTQYCSKVWSHWDFIILQRILQKHY